MPAEQQNASVPGAMAEVCEQFGTEAVLPAAVIVNADDWGRDIVTTDRILDCVLHRAVSSTSAMVFMADSERAASLAHERFVDTGLHLNFTQAFTASNVPAQVKEHQGRLVHFLRSNRFAPILYSPLLARSFEYVTKAQFEEYERLYGVVPHRFDGHHHRHLAANVLMQNLLPEGAVIRRNFTFAPGEKGAINRWYRSRQDRKLAKHYRITDYLFNIVPLGDRERLRRILNLGRTANVELEVHPGVEQEYDFLMRNELLRCAENVKIVRGFRLHGTPEAMTHGEAKPQRTQPAVAQVISNGSVQGARKLPHISVCICTYKRPEPLSKLLHELNKQSTDGLFTFSVVIADNDPLGSAKKTVEELQKLLAIPVKYCAEPERGIARARNKVAASAEGDYLAWIDDDEFPAPGWLKILFVTCKQYEVDGVLGPVKRHFDQVPPRWLKQSKLYDRRVNPTGMQVEWREARTGNVIIKRELIAGDPEPFRVEFRSGEDQDFFRRQMEKGRTFVWSADAIAYEVIPPARWKRMYYVRKALLHGAMAAQRADCGPKGILKSVIAVPLYCVGLPFALLAGQHQFMTVLVKLCDHAGKLLQLMKLNPIREEYVSD